MHVYAPPKGQPLKKLQDWNFCEISIILLGLIFNVICFLPGIGNEFLLNQKNEDLMNLVWSNQKRVDQRRFGLVTNIQL